MSISSANAVAVHRSRRSQTTANWQQWISDLPLPRADTGMLPSHDAIARLAYANWQARGCPHGSPELDWFQAEQELRRQMENGASKLDPTNDSLLLARS